MVRFTVYISYFLSHFTRTPVITLYEKSAGKGARHAWTSKATSIGALSYIAVQCYEHILSRQLPYRFRPMECVATRTRRFSLLPSLAFLCKGHGPTKLNRTCAGRILVMSLEGHLQVTSSKFDLDHSVTCSTHCYLNRMLFSHRRRFSLGLLAGADLQLMRLLKSQKNSIRFWLSLHCYFTQFSVQLGTGSNIVLDFFSDFLGISTIFLHKLEVGYRSPPIKCYFGQGWVPGPPKRPHFETILVHPRSPDLAESGTRP